MPKPGGRNMVRTAKTHQRRTSKKHGHFQKKEQAKRERKKLKKRGGKPADMAVDDAPRPQSANDPPPRKNSNVNMNPGMMEAMPAQSSPKMSPKAAPAASPALNRGELQKKLRKKLAGDSLRRTQGQSSGLVDGGGMILKKLRPKQS
eukprot:gnl/MRDRNA2_/MRDRNA2_125672_c0_seq1.p1 gnl/MRDRNA2_/MRDRNA2_125672_c0~~gnl/MRDRNA2_/MRDRNA2_125672_c0_seq1.p1  ORF type:complete len:147 (+),score=46.40 gnl/MRDRNA2_/MRDRNA2_125672_c0_seq1:150-590(+)